MCLRFLLLCSGLWKSGVSSVFLIEFRLSIVSGLFADVPTSVVGEHLKEQVEDRLKFYETGEQPRKNVDVMHDAMKEVQEHFVNAVKNNKS